MTTWPSTIPSYHITNAYSEQFPETAVRTEMDVGPAKIRRRITYNVAPLTIILDGLSKTQIASLETFYRATLLGGTLPFTWTHPRTGASVSLRFTSRPKVQPANGVTWRAEFGLEVLP